MIGVKRGGVVLLALVMLLGIGPAASIDGAAALRALAPRRVFAHYVMCCTIDGPNVSARQLGTEIALARRAGLDGFVLNIGAWTRYPSYPADTAAFFTAARPTAATFKLFFSLDPSGGLSPEEGARAVALYRDDPSYFRVGGRPVVSTFASSDRWNRALRALLRRQHIEIALVPHMVRRRSEGDEPGGDETPSAERVAGYLADDPELAGFFYFGAAASGARLAAVSRAAALTARSRNRLYIAPVTPYYRGFGRNNRVFDNGGFEGQSAQWMAAITGGATWAEIVTWNDWEERSYVRPLGAGAAAATGQWGLREPHDGFLDASRYFIDWFKTGRAPAIRQTRAFVAFRPDPLARCDRVVDRDPCPAGWRTLSDTLYVSIEATRTTIVALRAGQNSSTTTIPAGRTSLRLALTPGPIGVTLTSQGRTRVWTAPTEFGGAPAADRLDMAAYTVALD